MKKLVLQENLIVGSTTNPAKKLHVSGTKERRSTYKYYFLSKLKKIIYGGTEV